MFVFVLFEHTENSKQHKTKYFSKLKKSRRMTEMGIYQKNVNICFPWSTKIYFKDSHFKLEGLLYCRIAGATWRNLPVRYAFNNKLFRNSFLSRKRFFQHLYFQNCINTHESHIFLSFSCNSIFRCSSRC